MWLFIYRHRPFYDAADSADDGLAQSPEIRWSPP
jgi:hypothetical protein